MDSGRTFIFGPYRLEVPLRRLLRQGHSVPLTPKAFDVLLALIERRDRVVDKAELMKLVWPDSFVEEANLSQTIFVLRKTLGEGTDDSQRFIETVPRRGYRFAAQVEEDTGAELITPAPRDFGRWRDWRFAVPVIVALVVALVIGLWRMWPGGPASGAPVEKARVVVLPFENLTNTRADDWLAGAFSDSLTSGLQSVETLIPVGRDRIVELYRREGIVEAAAIDAGVLRRVTETLRVRYFVHGSYQKVGEQIRVSARLVDADRGTIEAQESVTGDFANLFAVEHDLAERFVRKLQSGVRRNQARAQTTSVAAYQALTDARTLYAQTRHNDAVAPLTRAITLDPQYAAAWALFGKNQARLGTITLISDGRVDEIRRAALTYARRAVELEPDLYDAHVALALAHRELEDFQAWRAEALKAIELNPRLAEAYELVADSYFAGNAWGCRRDRNAPLAERYFQTAIDIDPLWAVPYANLSYHFSWSGREDDALRTADRGLAILPDNATITRARALALVRLGRAADAEHAVRKMLDAGSPMSGQDHLVLGLVALSRGDTEAAAREFKTTAARLPTAMTFLAVARAYLDARHLEPGLSHLDRAVDLDVACAEFAAATPAFAAHRETEQFRLRLARWEQQAAGAKGK